jgi:hypothetical protein
VEPSNRADYIIVTVPENAGVVAPLAAYRSSHQSLAVTVVLLDSITSQFPRLAPDSSIRDFVTRTLTAWQKPAPQFLLLAGNINTIPSHKVASEFFPYFDEDSVLIDQWFVNQLTESQSFPAPGMAVGRFPAWTQDELRTMVGKTLEYEASSSAAWTNRIIAVADSTDYQLFETDASDFLKRAAARWPDTLSVHVRTTSPSHKTRAQFFELWNQGSAIINFVGHARGTRFSQALYFTARDVDSLANGSPLPFCLFEGPQRFDIPDTVSMSTTLLRTPGRGAVCAVAPSGLVYASSTMSFESDLISHLASRPSDPVGLAWLAAVGQARASVEMRMTLLGDPGLIIKSGGPASADNPPTSVPSEYVLEQNFPNPFNPSTTIRYGLPLAAVVQLTVFNTLGQKVATLVQKEQDAGYHEVKFEPAGLSSGLYFYRIQAGDFVRTRKLIFVR